VGQDGAIYGYAGGGGTLFGGVIYKRDPQGRLQILHHGEKEFSREVVLAVTANGDVYAGGESPWLLQLSKDGRHRYIPIPETGSITAMVETTNHEIVFGSWWWAYGLPEKGVLWRLNGDNEPQVLADVGSQPRVLVALPNGNVLCGTSSRVVEVSPEGQVSEMMHVFGINLDFLTADQDGSYLGSTSFRPGTYDWSWFRIDPGTKARTILGDQLWTFGSLNVCTWMAKVFPLRVAAENGNLPPMAKDDVVAAAAVKPILGSLPRKVLRVLRNDADRDRDALTIESVGEAKHGSVVLDAAKGTVTYTAASATVREDRFPYTVTDGKGGSATAQVIIRGNMAGRYQGEVLAANGATPGAVTGSLVVNVTNARALSGMLVFKGRSYPFTARFNEFNEAGAWPFPGREKQYGGIRLSLRAKEDGTGVVHAMLRRFGSDEPPNPGIFTAEFAAECELVP
jgi:hypothetical protein